MNSYVASVVVIVTLGIGTLASPVLAQSYNAPAGIAAATAPGGLEGRSGYANALDAGDLTTGSIAPRRGYGFAKEGYAGQDDFPVTKNGRTSDRLAR